LWEEQSYVVWGRKVGLSDNVKEKGLQRMWDVGEVHDYIYKEVLLCHLDMICKCRPIILNGRQYRNAVVLHC